MTSHKFVSAASIVRGETNEARFPLAVVSRPTRKERCRFPSDDAHRVLSAVRGGSVSTEANSEKAICRSFVPVDPLQILTLGMVQPLRNLRSFLEHRPPFVIFLVCLLSLAGCFFSFSFYVQTHEVQNPDVNQDWNQLLSALSQLWFCVPANRTDELMSPQEMKKTHGASPLIGKHASDREASSAAGSSRTLRNFSFVVSVHSERPSEELKPFNIWTTVQGQKLGFKGLGATNSLNLTIAFPWWPVPERDTSNGSEAHACVTVTAPSSILPKINSPPKCHNQPTTELRYVVPSSEDIDQADPELACHRFTHHPDPALTVMLSKDEKALAVQHLIVVSTFLLLLCAFVCILASSYSKKHKNHSNGADSQKESLIGS
ncbi:transmembrane protein 248 [Erpetoichthys calabaricus]|uniref:Transmembrane protein 248-like n=1 Tax=Erpetoichthys calabaricus TaxID=27687 RepID=A0A8C4XGL5_ERPCA|nr:transmembrane protein 248 [Erpetoichthys calabaricus]